MGIKYLIIGFSFIVFAFTLILLILPACTRHEHEYEKQHKRNLYMRQDLVVKYAGFLVLVGSIVVIVNLIAEYALLLSKN